MALNPFDDRSDNVKAKAATTYAVIVAATVPASASLTLKLNDERFAPLALAAGV